MNVADSTKSEPLRNYIDGEWRSAEGLDSLVVDNPSTREVLARVPLSDESTVDAAIESAHAAFGPWSRTPASRRAGYLYQLRELMQQRFDDICQSIVLENGKSIPDAQAELKRTLENLEVATGMPVLQDGGKLINCSVGIDCEVLRLPLGTFSMISPFNFPAMVPFWFFPYAVATGNTFVLKVSEQTPCTFQLITELINQTELPPGVFNLVHGDKTTANCMLRHNRIQGISAVGSTEMARHVAVSCARAGKRYQAMGGAKNHLVVMPDAKIDHVVRSMITSCYGCAGQRCMAASVVVCVGEPTYRDICRQFVEVSQQVVVGNPLQFTGDDETMVMGPVISQRAKSRIEGLIQTGVDEGARLVLDGRQVRPQSGHGYFVGPTVFTEVAPGSTIHSVEIFGPVVAILKVDSLESAIELINRHRYGNGASIYTQNGHYAREFKLSVQCGMIGVNVGIPAPVAQVPFGGMKDSLLSDIKAQGRTVIDFFTDQRSVTERFFAEVK